MYMVTMTILAVLAITIPAVLLVRQRSLSRRANLINEAILSRDFTFRLTEKGLLPSERALVRALNGLSQTVGAEMSRNEVKSWERLMRVLTHEIMNTTAPISSISQAMMKRQEVRGTSLEEGMRTIHSAACHLGALVENYRKLTQLQRPERRRVRLANLLEDVRGCYLNVKWQIAGAVDVVLYTDVDMLRQVLVNIVKNAVEAGADEIAIHVEMPGYKDPAGHLHLSVSNNGAPIPPESQSALFIPFFTTKSSGCGVGLSLSRQMMVALGGDVYLSAQPRSPYITTFGLNLSMR